jgi:hypothetical protein
MAKDSKMPEFKTTVQDAARNSKAAEIAMDPSNI